MLNKNLNQTLDMKILGDAKHILGRRTHKRFTTESAKPLSIPLSMHVKLTKSGCPKPKDEKEFMRKIPYQSIVGRFI